MDDALVELLGAEVALAVSEYLPRDPYEARVCANAYASEHLALLATEHVEAIINHAVALLTHAMQWQARVVH